MAKRTSSPLEAVIRENVRRLLKEQFGGKPGRVAGKIENVTLSRIQEFLDGGGCSLTYLQRYADAFGVKPYHLLIKDLDIKDPPELVSGKRLARLKALREEMLREENE